MPGAGVKTEKARQSCWCFTKSGRELAPVKPTRCHKMLDECTGFSRRLNTCEAEIKALKKATDALMSTSEKILTRPLPQVWDNNEAGTEVFPVQDTNTPLTQPGQLQRSKSMEMQSDVHAPLAAWQQEYQRAKSRMAEVDRQSLRLDAARREHYKGVQKHVKENVMQKDNVGAPRPQENESPELVAARTAFYKLEGEVWEELKQLEAHARDVQGYVTKAMELQGHTLINAASTHRQPLSGGQSATGGSAMGATTGATGAPGGGVGTGNTGQMHLPSAQTNAHIQAQ